MPKALRRDPREGVFTQADAHDFVTLLAHGNRRAGTVRGQRTARALSGAICDAEERKDFVYLLARLVKSFHFLTCFFTYPKEFKEFAAFAEYVGRSSSSRARSPN